MLASHALHPIATTAPRRARSASAADVAPERPRLVAALVAAVVVALVLVSIPRAASTAASVPEPSPRVPSGTTTTLPSGVAAGS